MGLVFCSIGDFPKDPTDTILLLYEFEASAKLNSPAVPSLLDEVVALPQVEIKTLETIAGKSQACSPCYPSWGGGGILHFKAAASNENCCFRDSRAMKPVATAKMELKLLGSPPIAVVLTAFFSEQQPCSVVKGQVPSGLKGVSFSHDFFLKRWPWNLPLTIHPCARGLSRWSWLSLGKVNRWIQSPTGKQRYWEAAGRIRSIYPGCVDGGQA